MACDGCLRRAAIVAAASPFIEFARDGRRRLQDILALDDGTLMRAVAGPRGGEILKRADALPLAGTAICRHEDGFPHRLLDDHTVNALFFAGDRARLIELTTGSAPAVAIVGTRRASPEGIRIAGDIGRGLAAAGVTVVSGMALGIDSAAHAGALDGGGVTVAVLASGTDIAYPRSKAALHRRLVAEAAVVSEFPDGTTPRKWGFPARNRIIAALAQATIVVEAAARSGSLITAEFALELGREVLAVPGSVRSWRADGTNALIRDGAMLVRDARDVLDAVLGAEIAQAATGRETLVVAPPEVGQEGRRLLQIIGHGQASADDLVRASPNAARALAALAELEMFGVVNRLPGSRFERRRA